MKYSGEPDSSHGSPSRMGLLLVNLGLPGPVGVALAMRYGHPSVAQGLDVLRRADCRRVLVFPPYPKYSATTTASVWDAVADVLRTWRWLPEIRVINLY